jgi:hypothetical protein
MAPDRLFIYLSISTTCPPGGSGDLVSKVVVTWGGDGNVAGVESGKKVGEEGEENHCEARRVAAPAAAMIFARSLPISTVRLREIHCPISVATSSPVMSVGPSARVTCEEWP